MTDPQHTPTPLAVRDALARGLATAWSDPPLDPDSAWIVWGPQARRAADALLASGVVRDPVTLPDDDALVDAGWRTEWAVEVTWTDWQKAGAKGPTSQFGPMETPEHRDRFLAIQRRDRDIAATRVLTRRAAYTAWEGGALVPTTEEERNRLLDDLHAALSDRPAPTTEEQP